VSSTEAWVSRRWRFIAALSWLISGALYLTLPPHSDQSAHDYMGWRLLQGDVPYHDFLDRDWPGTLWVHALSTALFGNHVWSWHALDFALLAGSAFFLQDLLKRSVGKLAAAFSLLLYPLFYAGLSRWFSGQHDMTGAQLLLGTVWFHVRGYTTKDWRWQLGTGAFLAAAMLDKPTLGILGATLATQALLVRTPLRRVLGHTAVAAGAAIGTLLMALLALLAEGCALREVIDGLFVSNLYEQYADPFPLKTLALTLFQVHLEWWPLLTLGGGVASVWIFRRPNRSIGTTVLPLLWISGVLSYLIQRRGYPYHLSACFPALVGLLAIALERAWAFRPTACTVLGWNRAAATVALIVLLVGGRKLYANYGALPLALLRQDLSVHWSRFSDGDGLTVADAVVIARRLERSVPVGETVLLLGTDRSINFLSRRAQSTRFYDGPFQFTLRPPLPMAKRWLTLLESDLGSTTASVCLIRRTEAITAWLKAGGPAAQALGDQLARSYQKQDSVEAYPGFDVYARR